ncbi:hypothetical protein [Winogradskyella poriferorum]|uniref:Uncharacterized protein n=1 Tax=Winogradskyella poriferorum TaxID=307627 RepID=A0ABU7W6K5_9FLAO
MKLLTKKKVTYVLNLVLLLILVVPYSYYLSHYKETEELDWIPNFVFQQTDLICCYLLIAILIIGFQTSKTYVLRKRFLTASLIVSFVYFIGGSFSLYLPVQDFSPGIGNVLALTLFPLIIIVFRLE